MCVCGGQQTVSVSNTFPSFFFCQKHDIPLSAVPCLQYLKALDQDKANSEENKENSSQEPSEEQNNEKVRELSCRLPFYFY